MQIDTFVKQMDSEDLGHLLAQCEVVREFRGSGRALVKATDKCSVEQVQAAVDRSVARNLNFSLSISENPRKIWILSLHSATT